jgi:hypothetical protein
MAIRQPLPIVNSDSSDGYDVTPLTTISNLTVMQPGSNAFYTTFQDILAARSTDPCAGLASDTQHDPSFGARTIHADPRPRIYQCVPLKEMCRPCLAQPMGKASGTLLTFLIPARSQLPPSGRSPVCPVA